jgi:hypothetical protein
MSWIPFAILAKKAIDAYIKYEDKQAARFRCRICWTNNHTTEEHQHPRLSAKRKSDLVKCQIALPFLLAALVGIPAYLIRGIWLQTVIEWLILWPIWAWAVAHRIRKEQRKENERAYERQI